MLHNYRNIESKIPDSKKKDNILKLGSGGPVLHPHVCAQTRKQYEFMNFGTLRSNCNA